MTSPYMCYPPDIAEFHSKTIPKLVSLATCRL